MGSMVHFLNKCGKSVIYANVNLGQKVEIFKEQEKLVHFTLFKELIICSNNIILIQNKLPTASSLYNIDSTSSPT